MVKPLPLYIEGAEQFALVAPKSSLVFSSVSAGWQGMTLLYSYDPPQEKPEVYSKNHVINIHVDVPPDTRSERRLDDRLQQEILRDGDIALTPANVLKWTRWNQPAWSINLLLQPEHLTQIAQESAACDRVELRPTFAQPDPLIDGIGRSLKSALTIPGMNQPLYVDSLTTALCLHLLRFYRTNDSRIDSAEGELSPAQLREAIAYLHAHLDRPVSLAAIAQHLQISRHNLIRQFKRSTGITPHRYLLQARLDRAKVLLATPIEISEIAIQLGFENERQFVHWFQRLMSMTPTAYRQEL